MKRDMNYKPIALGDISTIDNTEWLKWRMHGPFYSDPTHPHYVKTGIGGSDVSIIFNLSPFVTSLELYHKKIGVEPKIPMKKNEKALKAGHRFEKAIGEVFVDYMKEVEQVEDIEYIQDNIMYRSGELELDEDGYPVIDMATGETKLKYPFAIVNLDARCRVKRNGKWVNAGVEIKTTSARNYDVIEEWKAGIVPIYYELQCRYYMAATNIDEWFICVCWGFTPDDMKVISIKRDLAIEEHIMETVKDFVYKIENKIEPDVSECKAELINDYYNHLYGLRVDAERVIELDPDEYLPIYEQAENIQKDISKKEIALKKAKEMQEEIYKKLYIVFGDHKCGKLETDDKTYYLTLKQPTKRASLDNERFKTENPALYEEFKKVEEKVDTTRLKKCHPDEYNKYLKPEELSTDSTVGTSFKLSVKEKEKIA